MDITNITNFKPDTELHNDNPFQRTEFERAKKARMIGKGFSFLFKDLKKDNLPLK